MPIYAYRCLECSHQIEALQRASDAPLTTCPCCQKESLSKEITAPRVRLSGSGYYETDEKPKEKQRHIATKESEPAPTSAAGQQGA